MRCGGKRWSYQKSLAVGKIREIAQVAVGMRQAAAAWEEDYAGRMEKIGYRRGRGAPTVFVNFEKDVRVVVHGDDFTCSGGRRELESSGGT